MNPIVEGPVCSCPLQERRCILAHHWGYSDASLIQIRRVSDNCYLGFKNSATLCILHDHRGEIGSVRGLQVSHPEFDSHYVRRRSHYSTNQRLIVGQLTDS